MAKVFNVTGACIPEQHYMVNIDERLKEIKVLVDSGKYFTINKARQYGKTTTLIELREVLHKNYYVVLMDFQMFGAEEFKNENVFALSFARIFVRALKRNTLKMTDEVKEIFNELADVVKEERGSFRLQRLFEALSNICEVMDRKVVLMIDEVDSASNNQVFLDFLAQIRAYYLSRMIQPTFQSVILAGVYDVKNLKRKLRSDENHKQNSPWNISAQFDVNMNFSKDGIAGMLQEYENDYHTGMNIEDMADLIGKYTAGYPFLVSRLCQLMDVEIPELNEFGTRVASWTQKGFHKAVKLLLTEENTLFESLSEKLTGYPELSDMLQKVLFTGEIFTYNYYEPSMNLGTMFGFVKEENGMLAIANRIFETWLYNYYLSSSEMQNKEIYKFSIQDKNQFIRNGHLDMEHVLEKFIQHFDELYGDQPDRFAEEDGRRYFLLYLRPIINGTGNYYIEAQTRNREQTDVIVDYLGEQIIVELKIWRGNAYNIRGEKQLSDYLEYYHLKKGYMLSFNFNKKKEIGIKHIALGEKLLVEAVV